jgi:hypothetical protein
MLQQPRELAVLIQTRLPLVVAVASGHNPLKACGLLFAYLAAICNRTAPGKPQVWRLDAAERAGLDPWNDLKRVAEHQNRDANDLWAEFQLDSATFARSPLEA